MAKPQNEETKIQNQIMLDLSKAGLTVFRNSTGQGWAGRVVDQGQGYITLSNPSPLIAGLCVGSPDIVGWYSVVITPEMVGKRVALSVMPEVKTPLGKASEAQLKFNQVARKAGVLTGFVRSTDEALALLGDFIVR